MVPTPGSLSKSIVPPCFSSMISLEIESPCPVPSPTGFVVKPASNAFAFCSGVMPRPVSAIEMCTMPPSSRVRTVIFPSPSIACAGIHQQIQEHLVQHLRIALDLGQLAEIGLHRDALAELRLRQLEGVAQMLVQIHLARLGAVDAGKASSARGSRSGSARRRSGPPPPGSGRCATIRRAFSIDSGRPSASSGSSISSERRITSVFEKIEPIGRIDLVHDAGQQPADGGHLVQFGSRRTHCSTSLRKRFTRVEKIAEVISLLSDSRS